VGDDGGAAGAGTDTKPGGRWRKQVDGRDIINRAALVELLVNRCRRPEPFPAAPADPDQAMDAVMHVAADSLARRQAKTGPLTSRAALPEGTRG
jgi:hypothetical protein